MQIKNTLNEKTNENKSKIRVVLSGGIAVKVIRLK